MKIWVTRNSALSVQMGGLDRLTVWFTKPVFYLVLLSKEDRETPIGDILETEIPLYNKYGWGTQYHDNWSSSHSFGKMFGYGDVGSENEELVNYVWNQLKKHFNNANFNDWHDLEKLGSCKKEDFCLEIDLDVKLKL